MDAAGHKAPAKQLASLAKPSLTDAASRKFHGVDMTG